MQVVIATLAKCIMMRILESISKSWCRLYKAILHFAVAGIKN
jgi:hypothetical protein